MKHYPRLSLAQLPTPIHELKSISKELGKKVYIWRDDLTACMESGNKLRKLEYLMSDACSSGADWIVTCGAPQSNHTRASAAIARRLGFGISVVSVPKPGFDVNQASTANYFLNQIYGSEITWIQATEYLKQGASYDSFLLDEVKKLKARGKTPYVIPLGGSNAIGCLGYLRAVEEMIETWKASVPHSSFPDSLFCALGSGGTFVGLELGLHQLKLRETKLLGINVIGPMDVPLKYVSKLRAEAEIEFDITLDSSNTEMVDGYVGQGYGIASDEDLAFYIRLAREEGVFLDPCYTGKAFQGMLHEVKQNPSRFGEEILFLHSGGNLGNFAYLEQYQNLLKNLSRV